MTVEQHEPAQHERELLERLQHSNDEVCRSAFREFVERFQRRLYALAYDLTGNHADAEDLAQDVFVKAFTSINKFQGQSQLFTWLHRMAVNTFLDMKRTSAYRSLRNGEQFNEEQWNSSTIRPDAATEAVITDERIQTALQQCSPRERAVFVLRHYHDQALDDIAQTLGVTDGTVKTLLFRATKTLREALSFYTRELNVNNSLNTERSNEQ